jgi:predicted Zn-ribbon and HTH transcriptional regulator
MKNLASVMLTCLKCAYRWIPRKIGRPVECPACKRRDWDKPKRKE